MLDSEILRNCQFSPNVADFVHNYLRLGIGEPILVNAKIHNARAPSVKYTIGCLRLPDRL